MAMATHVSASLTSSVAHRLLTNSFLSPGNFLCVRSVLSTYAGLVSEKPGAIGATSMKPVCWCALLAFAPVADAQTQLTIYNQDFAAVKEQRVLNLRSGVNEFRLGEVTAHLEPDSVVLRDLDRADGIRILEQNYESEPLSEGMLLLKAEGKTIGFEVIQPNGQKSVIQGRILRSGYAPRSTPMQAYGSQYGANPGFYNDPFGGGTPIVEVEGKILFALPGQPIFDSLDP